MGTTRWGDILDVLTSAVSEKVLSCYKVVALLGPVKLDNTMNAGLDAFAKNGGTLLLAAGMVGPGDSDLCGIKILPELWAGTAWRWKDEPFIGEPFRYCPVQELSSASVQVLARTAGGNPLITCYKIGKGLVYTCLVPWFEGVASMAGVAARLFDEVIGSVQPVSIEGLPIHRTNSVRDGEVMVALANSSEVEWKGRVRVPAADVLQANFRELLTGVTISTQCRGREISCEVVVPPFDICVISITS